jgi:hypothetical protein
MPCRKQLARFPETAAIVAAEVLAKANEEKDEEYQNYLIDFVSDCVPIGEAWKPMREPVQALVRALEGTITCQKSGIASVRPRFSRM